jgi:hypothetical protein
VHIRSASPFIKRRLKVYSLSKEGGEGNMKTKQKVLVVTLVTVAVASALLYMPLTSALQPEAPDVEGEHVRRCRPWLKARLGLWFLNHSEPVEVEGAAVTLVKGMLVVNTAEGQIRIHLPQEWIVDEELIMRGELFESDYLSVGENITVKALSGNVIDKEGLRIYLLLGYEIIDESSVHAYAALPFNIET